MKIEKQITTVEQSQKLVELGFEMYSASLEWTNLRVLGEDGVVHDKWVTTLHDKWLTNSLPCWTIADMMKILHKARGFDLDVLGRIGIYSADEPCKTVVGKDITVRDDYSLLRDNFFEALVELKENKYL